MLALESSNGLPSEGPLGTVGILWEASPWKPWDSRLPSLRLSLPMASGGKVPLGTAGIYPRAAVFQWPPLAVCPLGILALRSSSGLLWESSPWDCRH